ncbi:MAG TPA: DUF839 domain-containing protein, partial [Polyangiaceae bacterium LLY-WYZ-15_(1-7)]|nr:DUF839 domain-containing protein [Polyangiaceae bacterium LLY-WYZ-15_(1-7)]
ADAATNIRELVATRVDQVARGALPNGVQFPLRAATTDTVRAIDGLRTNVVAAWLDELTYEQDAEAARFGANADFTAFIGDGALESWDTTRTTIYQGDSTSGWIWVNHEYISGARPSATSAPLGQHRTLAKWMRMHGVLAADPFADVWEQASIDTYVEWHKRQVGGSWARVVQDPSTKEWHLDLGAPNMRYDATSNTLVTVTGLELSGRDQDDSGTELPEGVVAGIHSDCSGFHTPWGTIFSAEENVQGAYGDLEPAWTSHNRFVAGVGFDPGSAITFDFSSTDDGDFGRHSDPNQQHLRDGYGYLAEIDPGVAASTFWDGSEGHQKLGAMGRARWENATAQMNEDWQLVDGEPVTIYAADDRRGGRVYKFVTSGTYEDDMTRAEVRGLLDEGTVYVAHFAGLDNETGLDLAATDARPVDADGQRGEGRWIELSLTSTDIAPNAGALGDGSETVGEALQDVDWNGIGGFSSQTDVLRALFTASMKIGAMETNRPEDLEWNPMDGLLYIAFTKHGRQVGLDQDGVLYDPSEHAAMSPLRPDPAGAVFALRENGDGTFEYFQVWGGTEGEADLDAANPDNLMIDAMGGVWFGTDGNFGTNGAADALYYIDTDPAHRAGEAGVVQATYGLAFRVVAGPSDSEATGPSLTPDLRTLFFNVQHPGERNASRWPSR